MKIPSIITSARIVCAASLLSLSFGASAATTWAVGDFLDNAASTSTAKNISAWSTTGTSPAGSFASACLHEYTNGSINYGWGIVNTLERNPCTGEPGIGPHAADNVGTVDLFLVEFNSAVSLTKVNIGWNGTDDYSNDSDISVLAYTGASLTTPSIAGLLTSNLITNSWQSIGNYANVGSSANVGSIRGSATVSTSVSSSWWLISAYHKDFGEGDKLGGGNDYFKLLSVAGTVDTKANETPEPGSLALAALGLLSIVGLRRRAVRR